MIKTLITSLLLAAITLAHPLQSTDEWVKYIPEDGRFSVLFPRQPRTSATPGKSATGADIMSHLISSTDVTGNNYMLGFVDYPYQLDQEKSLDEMRNGALGAVKAELLREYKITLDKNPGREFMASVKSENAELLAQSRIFVVDSRTYMLLYLYPKSLDAATAAKTAAKFFDSFKLSSKTASDTHRADDYQKVQLVDTPMTVN
jgi:hypothetical protein